MQRFGALRSWVFKAQMFVKALMLIRITKVGIKHFRPNFLKPLLCPRCGFQGRKFNLKTIFKMKLIALGDTHGRADWKKIVSNTEFDKVVFIGDYFDTHEDITPEQQKSNFEDLIAYKKANMNKVVLLFGNHDYHYLRSVNETYSGFQEWHKTDIAEMLHKALDADLMQMCLIDGNYIFSHAGITKTWLKNTGYTGEDPLELFINDLFKYQPLAFKFTSGINHSPYGNDVCQTPIWVRPQSLYADCLDNFIQVVGHTTQKQLKIIDDKIVLIDTIGMSGQFLCITDGEMSVLELSRSNGA